MKFARFEVERPPGPDTVTVRAKLKGAQGFAKPVELLVLSASAPREALDRFLQGGARLAELADGNLLQVLEVGYEDGRAFLATEASAGESFAKLLERCRERGLEAVPAALAFGIGAELAKALAHAHAHVDSDNKPDPVTHGALRSEAITVGEDGAVKLGGFVPWRAAPSPADDVEKLTELVGQWVSQPDKKLVRESATGVTEAAQLRKAWSAYQALHWPQLAPDARRTLVAFAQGQATKQTLESKLGARPVQAPVPKWAFAVGGVAAALVAVALLWPASEPPARKDIELPPPPKLPKSVVQKDERFSDTLVVDGSEHHLVLPAELPSASAPKGEVWFEEGFQIGKKGAAAAAAPQLYATGEVAGRQVAGTVSRQWWRLAGAREVRFFSWEPFDPRYWLADRALFVAAPPLQRLLPIAQPALEIEAPGLKRHVPTHKQLVVSVSAAPDAGTPLGPLLVAVSYGTKAPPYDDPRWPFGLTRLALGVDQSSPTLEDAQELAFISLNAGDSFLVHLAEGGKPRDELWPGILDGGEAPAPRMSTGPVALGGRYEGSEAPAVLGPECWYGELYVACAQKCVASAPGNSYCQRSLTRARELAAEKAPPAPGSPETR